jgi:hypothetical protein
LSLINPILETLTGLERLQTIDEDLILRENESLTTLDSLTAISGNFTVVDNRTLSTSAATALVTRMSVTGWTGEAVISGNRVD